MGEELGARAKVVLQSSGIEASRMSSGDRILAVDLGLATGSLAHAKRSPDRVEAVRGGRTLPSG